LALKLREIWISFNLSAMFIMELALLWLAVVVALLSLAVVVVLLSLVVVAVLSFLPPLLNGGRR
jgi:hypothetical protein